jgi:hypothetical protein
MDHADSSLARGAEPLYDSLAGADADSGKGGIMNRRLLQRWEREEALPLPSRSHPQNQKTNSVVYTEELTDLSVPLPLFQPLPLSRARAPSIERKQMTGCFHGSNL